jgi:hypothetical protein
MALYSVLSASGHCCSGRPSFYMAAIRIWGESDPRMLLGCIGWDIASRMSVGLFLHRGDFCGRDGIRLAEAAIFCAIR